MHRKSAPLLALVALLAGSATALAQSGAGGQVELGTYGVFNRFDEPATNLASGYGVGGRLGLYFSRLLSLEASGDYTPTEIAAQGADVGVTRLAASLLLHARALGFYLGGGYERSYYRGALQGQDDGAHLVLGSRLSPGGRAAMRLEAKVAYLPSGGTSANRPINFSGNIGLSVFAFGGPPRDSDRDKVANKKDRCPDTPLGARVDAQGCPTDGDRDGVYDGLDACDGTPSGAIVDETGCPLDTDRDSVFDGIDLCPNTPMGASVDPNGCPTDQDRDGVFDGLDRCADTPAGAAVDAFGCPLDTDGDGVFDGLDQCPDTPAGSEVDQRGCTVQRDSDGDGVLDQNDRCPNTAPGQRVDEVGCPVIEEVVQAQARNIFEFVEGRAQPLVLTGVNFRPGSAQLIPESYATLDRVAASLLANPAVRIEVAGHTDASGSRALNLRLSLARAEAVRNYLISKGVAPDRLVARGYGPDRPVADNSTPSGRAMNRRVELNLIEGREP
jgi:outer membrane protein OmpA-like peptidoglycan-associated protein